MRLGGGFLHGGVLDGVAGDAVDFFHGVEDVVVGGGLGQAEVRVLQEVGGDHMLVDAGEGSAAAGGAAQEMVALDAGLGVP